MSYWIIGAIKVLTHSFLRGLVSVRAGSELNLPKRHRLGCVHFKGNWINYSEMLHTLRVMTRVFFPPRYLLLQGHEDWRCYTKTHVRQRKKRRLVLLNRSVHFVYGSLSWDALVLKTNQQRKHDHVEHLCGTINLISVNYGFWSIRCAYFISSRYSFCIVKFLWFVNDYFARILFSLSLLLRRWNESRLNGISWSSVCAIIITRYEKWHCNEVGCRH